MLNRRQFLAGSLAAQAPPRQPNLLFIFPDQWRAQTLPPAGDANLIAPNLARLAREGIHFQRCYVANPVCTPSRTAVMTGKFPHACRMPYNNLLLPLEEKCFAEQLKKGGYATGYIGKFHLDGEGKPGFVPPGPRRRGFDYWAGFNRGHLYYRSAYFLNEDKPLLAEGFEPDYQTDLAVSFIERNRTRPFFLFLSWGPPHTPRTPPPRYARTYNPAAFRLRDNVPLSYGAQAREGHAGYYGLCTALDDNVGRLLRCLDQQGLSQDTIVVFTSDHGDMLGSHGLEHKGVPFEESVKVPLLLRYPRRIGANRTEDILVSNVDLMPTLLALCGAAVPDAVQGRDLSAWILDGEGRRPESIYAEGRLASDGEWRMVVRGFDKLVVDSKIQVTHLFNLAQDPFEMNNLAADKATEHARKRDELKALLRRWILNTADRVPYPAPRRRKADDDA